jgi:FtsZ-interacting cell division protein ZipA
VSATGWVVLVIVVVVIIVLVALWAWSRSRRRDALRSTFGPEYDRTVEERGSRAEAERDLERRAERHDALQIRPLSAERRDRYADGWQQVQAHFVDDPRGAMTEADDLVQQVMQERGYPTGSFEQQAADLSVEHADVLDHYREAHTVVDLRDHGQPTTEQMRTAMVHYRALFTELLDTGTTGPDAAEVSR